MADSIQYAYRIDPESETPCHISELKKGDAFYLISGSDKSELFRATDNAFSTDVNNTKVWSVPHEAYE